MQVLPFLVNQQLGTTPRIGGYSSNRRLNLDPQLSNLVCARKDVYFSCGQRSSVPPFACKFRRDDERDLLAVANEDGEILLIDTEKGRLMDSFVAHQNAIFDICWLPRENKLITGSGDHRLCLFDMNVCKKISSFSAHSASVKTVDVCLDGSNNLFAAGSRDGNISIWDRREQSDLTTCSKPSIFILSAHSRKHLNLGKNRSSLTCSVGSVSGVAFKDCHTLVSSGVIDGVIKVWDLRKTYITKPDHVPNARYQMKYSDDRATGCTSLMFDSSYTTLYASSTANKIYQFDCHSYSNDVVTFSGFKCSTYFVKSALSSDDQYLLSGSSDNKAYIWKTKKPGLPILELSGHAAEVTSVAWSPHNPTKLVTCGDDNKVFIWRYHNPDMEMNNQDIFESACAYSNDDKKSETDLLNDISFSRTSTPLNLTRTVTAPSGTPRSPAIQSITSFFPLTSSSSSPPDSPCPAIGNCSDSFLQNHTVPSQCISPVLPSQPRSPCKALSGNDGLVSAEGAASTSRTSPKGKENSSTSSPDTTGHLKPNAQLKRKLPASSQCKHHPNGCGRTRGHTRCGKKIVIRPEKGNIKNYFIVSPPEK